MKKHFTAIKLLLTGITFILLGVLVKIIIGNYFLPFIIIGELIELISLIIIVIEFKDVKRKKYNPILVK